MEPRQGSLDDPSGATESTAVRVSTSGELRANIAGVPLVAVSLRVIRAIALYEARLAAAGAGAPAQRRDAVDKW